MLKIQVSFVDKNKFSKLIRYIENNMVYFEAQEQVRVIGHHAADSMQKTIKESGYNLDNLANSILAETLNTTGGVEIGVGRIESLPFYWALFDSGFKPGASLSYAPLGSFIDGKPDASKSGGVWIVGGGPHTFFDLNINKKPVEPLDFVQKSVNQIDVEFKEMIKKLGESWIEGMSKV
jgi:hypothetical protein